LDHGQVDVIFDQGPINIVARCSQEDGVEFIQMELTLHNTQEDMLVYGSIRGDFNLSKSPIGASNAGVLNKHATYTGVMWEVWDSGYGNDWDSGAVALKTLTSAKTYYVGWDSESFVGIANTNDLRGGGNCALTGVFHYVFPEVRTVP
jgi:hypothetical protein